MSVTSVLLAVIVFGQVGDFYVTASSLGPVMMCPDNGFLHCNRDGYVDAVKVCACATFSESTNTVQVGHCIYGCSKHLNSKRNNLPVGFNYIGTNISNWNDASCGYFGRGGTLCGACSNGSYPPAYSIDMKCVECSNGSRNVWIYLLQAFLPLTLFYFILLLLQINIVSSTIFGFVFYSQIISTPMLLRALVINRHNKHSIGYIFRAVGSLYGIWNLDFFRTFNRGICLETDTLTTLSLDFVIAIYPLFLITLTYFLIILHDRNTTPLTTLLKPFLTFFSYFKKNWNIRTSAIDSFATFILLSNVKLLATCIDILTPVDVYQINSLLNVTHSRQLYYDATIQYFGPKHLPYAILAIVLLLALVFLPTLLLLLYPIGFVQQFLSKLPSRCILFLNTFVDSFQGCYKNGTDPGSRDYRCMSVLPFLIRLVVFIIYACTLTASFFPIASIVSVITATIIIITDPFRKNFKNVSYHWVVYSLLLACLGVCACGLDILERTSTGKSLPPLVNVFHGITYVMVLLPVLGIALVTFLFIFKRVFKLLF